MNVGSFQTITIQRAIPVINGFARPAPNFAKDRNKLTLATALSATGGSVLRLDPTGGASLAGGKYGVQELVLLPQIGISEIDTASQMLTQIASSYPMIDDSSIPWLNGSSDLWYLSE